MRDYQNLLRNRDKDGADLLTGRRQGAAFMSAPPRGGDEPAAIWTKIVEIEQRLGVAERRVREICRDALGPARENTLLSRFDAFFLAEARRGRVTRSDVAAFTLSPEVGGVVSAVASASGKRRGVELGLRMLEVAEKSEQLWTLRERWGLVRGA